MKIGGIFSFIAILPLFTTSQSNIKIQGDSVQVKEWLKYGNSVAISNTVIAKLYADKALQLSESINYINGKAAGNILLGNIAFYQKNYSPAIEYYEKAKPLFIQQKNDYALAQVIKSTADAYRAGSFIRKAFENYREAVPLLRNTNQIKLLNDCHEAMGEIVLNFREPANAIVFFKRSLQLKSSLNDHKGIISTNAKIASIFFSLKQYDSALFYNKEVQRLEKQNAATLEIAAIEEINIYSFLGKIAEADIAKKKATVLVEKSGNITNKIKLLLATSNFYLAQKNKEGYTKYFDSAATIIESVKSPELAAEGFSLLADMSNQQGDYKTAYRMAKMAAHFKDKFRTDNIDKISAELKNETEANLKETEIRYLNLVNKYKEEQLNKEELKQMALLRENILKDSSLANQQLLMAAIEKESELRNNQLTKEKELSLSLSRENDLKQKLLTDEKRNKAILWTGLAAMTLLVGVIFFQYKRQQKKNTIINKQSTELGVLNKEIHHRVKNNLQVISSMLDLQSQSLHDEKATAIIKEGIQRVQSMAFIHQNLYQGDAANSVNMNEYIKMLSRHLFQTYNIRTDKIKFHTHIEDLKLHTDTAIPLGMILNELISNALKYAFVLKDTGNIWVTMKKNNTELLLQVKDDGAGLNKDFNPEISTSFGYEIIKAFAQKMKARMNVDGTNGTEVQIIISKFKIIG